MARGRHGLGRTPQPPRGSLSADCRWLGSIEANGEAVSGLVPVGCSTQWVPSPQGGFGTPNSLVSSSRRRSASLSIGYAMAIHKPMAVGGTRVVGSDRLRLIFTCCHPALSTEAQIALTLRLLGGLQTPEIASSVPRPRLDDGPALGASKTQDPGRRGPVPGAGRDRAAQSGGAGSASRIPGNRLRAVMAVVYLVFNAGYSAADSHDLVRVELCVEAVPESVPEPDRPDPVFGTGRETVRAGRMLSVVVVPETTESGTGIRAWGGRAAPLSALPGLPPGSASRSIRDLSA